LARNLISGDMVAVSQDDEIYSIDNKNDQSYINTLHLYDFSKVTSYEEKATTSFPGGNTFNCFFYKENLVCDFDKMLIFDNSEDKVWLKYKGYLGGMKSGYVTEAIINEDKIIKRIDISDSKTSSLYAYKIYLLPEILK